MPRVALSIRTTPVGDGNGGISAMYIVGFSIAGTALLAIALWLAIYLVRKRRARQRQDQLGTAFLSVRGLVKENKTCPDKDASLQTPEPTTFPQANMNPRIALPTKALIKTSPEQLRAERDYFTTRHPLSNDTPKPFSLALQTSASPSPTLNERLSVVRNSYAASSRMSHYSVFSATSSFNESIISVTSSGGAGRSIRKIRQTFNAVLPDELFITLGEQLMILQSFDDGWCVVGRESGILMPQPKNLFGGSRISRALTPTLLFGHGGVGTTSGGNVELGMVPAWCFLKPVKGLRAERPVRSSSLGVTVQMDRTSADRNDMISWSNF